MAVSFVDKATASGSSGIFGAITIPATVQAGDTLLLIISSYSITSVTTPSGWTLLGNSSMQPHTYVYRKTAVAGDAGTSLTPVGTKTSANAWTEVVVAYRGVTATPQIAFAATTPPSVGTGQAVLGVYGVNQSATLTPTSGANARASVAQTSSGQGSSAIVIDWLPSGSHTAGPTGTWAPSSVIDTAATVVLTGNQAPNAPTLNSPANNATVDRGITQRFAWTFSDPDAGDSQSKFDLQYRIVGAATWTTVSSTTPNAFYDFAAGTFAAGNYEWQVRTYDSQGLVGPWSSSSFFTAADATDAPIITAPTSGSTVPNTATVTWSGPNQTDYQVRRVADNAGAADTSAIYWDSGDVVDSVTRSIAVTFDTNNRYEHLQVRVKYNGLWSAWADVRVNVSYTPPAKAVVTLYPNSDGGLDVGWSNPTPAAGQPSVAYVDVLIDDDDGAGEIRKATQLAANAAWTYALPRSGVDYAPLIRVAAVATNGTVSYSDPATEAPVYVVIDGGTASGTGSGTYDGGGV